MKLALEKIDVRFRGQTIIEGLNLSIETHGITAIIGPSGIGKTTLLRVIAGLVPISAGRRQANARIATIFQDARLLPWQSAVDNAAFGLRARGMARQRAREHASGLLHQLGFSDEDQKKSPRALSGGMRQRVSIARALAIEPDLLLMDEAFTGLDVTLRANLQRLVRSIVDERKLAALLVTHDPVEAVALAERVIVLGGRPAKIYADLPLLPRPNNQAEIYAAAADLMRRREVAVAFGSSEP
jgi:NitT/TauT family transport system ATP-binding protein